MSVVLIHCFPYVSRQDEIGLHGEVYFPNLQFEKTEVNFGCILNDTEVTRYVSVLNNSPMDVKYHWSFLIDGQPVASFNRPPPQQPMSLDLEGVGESNGTAREVVTSPRTPCSHDNTKGKSYIWDLGLSFTSRVVYLLLGLIDMWPAACILIPAPSLYYGTL